MSIKQILGQSMRCPIASQSNRDKFKEFLKIHQKGETDYFTFCNHCAEKGVEKWIVDLSKMTCTYYDKAGNELLVENVLSV